MVHHWEIRSPAPWPNIPLSHIILPPISHLVTLSCDWYPTQSHYPDMELPSLFPILLMLGANLGRDKYQFHKSLVWLDWSPAREARTLPIWPSRPDALKMTSLWTGSTSLLTHGVITKLSGLLLCSQWPLCCNQKLSWRGKKNECDISMFS